MATEFLPLIFCSLDANRKPVSVILASAYAPIGAAKELIRQDFAPQLERCFSALKSDQVLLMGIDHFLISRRDLSHVSNVGLSKLTVESDHELLHINLPIARNLSKQHESKANFINHGMLRDLAVARNFRHAIWKHLGNDPLCPELLKYPALRNGLHVSSKEVLPVSERKHAGWFKERQQLVIEAIAVCNQAQPAFNRKCKSGEPKPHPEHEILQHSRKQLKLAVAAAKIYWMAEDGRQNQRFWTGQQASKDVLGRIGIVSITSSKVCMGTARFRFRTESQNHKW
jgi:hypothetical protein